MNHQAVMHLSNRQFILPIQRDCLSVKFIAGRDDLRECCMVYWKRSEPYPDTCKKVLLNRTYRDWMHDDFRAVIQFPEPVHYIKYYFKLTDAMGEEYYYSEYGFTKKVPDNGLFEFLYACDHDVAKTPEWSKGIVYYQIFPERYSTGGPVKSQHRFEPWNSAPTRDNFLGGNLEGIRRRLDYLYDLGAECLYLTPVFKGDFNHKYATTDYYKIDPDFGTNDDLIALVKDAHRKNIRIILDGVFNHVGIHFPPFEDLLVNGVTSPYRDWFYLKAFPLQTEPLNYECVGDYHYMPKLRTSHPKVREMVLHIMLYWIREAGIDGWRLDVADEVDFSTWQYIRTRVKEEYPDALLLGETWGDASNLISCGDQLDSAMNYLIRDAAIDYFANGRIDETGFDQRIQHVLMKYPDHVNHTMYNCLGSHDTPRFLTEAGGDVNRMMLAVAFQMTFVGGPAIYYGDEVGMTGDNDPGCRAGMVWDKEKQNTKLLDWYKKLIALRKKSAALRLGSFRICICEVQRHLFGYAREIKDESVYVIFNRGSESHTVSLMEVDNGMDLLTGCHADFTGEPGARSFLVPPHTVKIIQKTGGEKPCVP